ncbi:MAG: S-layer-like protein array protein, partial [uncultured bacterium]
GGGSSIATQSTGQGGDPLSAAPQFYPIVINEIMYSLDGTDSGREWVELYNSGTTAVDINDWKLFENDTNHGLTVAQGSGTIPAGGYAVVVDDKTSFLVDNAGFSGTIFDSTFSLSDSGESLTLKNSTLTIDTYTYASSTGADGNGMSLQRFSDGWFAASTTPGSLNIKNTAIAAETEETVATTTESTAASTSTLLWDGGSQSGVVFDLLATDFVGQRVSFATAVTVGSLEFGYYNDYGAGSTEVKIFSETGVERFATTLAVPTLRYGGYITHVLTEPLQLTAGDYFIGSRLVSGNIGIRKGTKANVCAKAVYASGVIPACGTGDDVSMRINTWTAEAATTSSATTTAEIATTTAATSTATSTQPSSDATAGEATPQFHPVVINEIMYDVDGSDDNREWIEVYNAGTSSVDIADWKFFEGDTHHGLSVTQGSSLLASNGYAVIVANPVAFLSDNASFSGTIFDSSFSLNKTGETLVLKNGDLAIDTVAYIAGTSTNGTGMSLQRFSDGWSGASTTPGTINVLQPIVIVVEEATSTATTTPAETATSTDPVDATPPPITTLTQSNSEAKSASEIIKSYLQGIGMNKMGSVKTIKVYGEGALGQWKGGICQSTSASQCDTTKPKHLVYSQETITTSEVKSLLTFNFSSVVTLDADTSYYVFLEPPFTSDLKKQHSSVYGASDNVYLDGGLRSMDFGLDGYPGIKDMYFEIQ